MPSHIADPGGSNQVGVSIHSMARRPRAGRKTPTAVDAVSGPAEFIVVAVNRLQHFCPEARCLRLAGDSLDWIVIGGVNPEST